MQPVRRVYARPYTSICTTQFRRGNYVENIFHRRVRVLPQDCTLRRRIMAVRITSRSCLWRWRRWRRWEDVYAQKLQTWRRSIPLQFCPVNCRNAMRHTRLRDERAALWTFVFRRRRLFLRKRERTARENNPSTSFSNIEARPRPFTQNLASVQRSETHTIQMKRFEFRTNSAWNKSSIPSTMFARGRLNSVQRN